MAKADISQEINFEDKFAVMHFLDGARWQKGKELFYPNFAYPNNADKAGLSFDEKLLTHWLLYITDRQMPFRQIWDKGGFVFSEIARRFTSKKNISHLTDFSTNFAPVQGGGYGFQSTVCYGQVSDEQRKRLARYYSHEELQKLREIEFKSRFYTDDYVCTLYTLSVLQSFKCSLTEYLAQVLTQVSSMKLGKKEDQVQYAVWGMAYALHRLTYDVDFTYQGKRITSKSNEKDKIEIQEFLKAFQEKELGEEHCKRIQKEIFDDAQTFKKALDGFFKEKDKYTKMKRVWCALRDYLKDPAYCDDFQKALQSKGVDAGFLNELFDDRENHQKACRWIELPGDVWNENSEFRRCITKNTDGKLGELLRALYDKISPKGYPEEFDTTFDFVPRMCEAGRCDVCPFSEKTDAAKLNALCADNTNQYCPLVLLYCGYYYKCQGKENCSLQGIFKKKSLDKSGETEYDKTK